MDYMNIYINAKMFLSAVNIVNKDDLHNMNLCSSENDKVKIECLHIFPKIVLRSFASELFLKCLIVKEGKQYNECHDLYELYFRLDKATRDYIRNLFIRTYEDVLKKPYSNNFYKELREVSNIFADTRYWHEGGFKINVSFFNYFASAIEGYTIATIENS